MATRKGKGEGKGTTDINFRSAVRNPVVPMANDSNKDESHIPWSLLISIVVMCIVLVIVIPVMGVMYLDMNNATSKAMQEINKIKELRLQILKEKNDNRQSTETTPP